MPLRLPRKKRKIPEGFRLGKGGCHFEAIGNNGCQTGLGGTAADKNNSLLSVGESNAIKRAVRRRREKEQSRKPSKQ
jgi:hypothetical protein